jgi:hypothetical protein
MPKILTFMYCDRAEPNHQGQLQIINPLLVLNPIFIPGMYSFSIAFGVMGINNDEDHTFRIQFLSPNEDQPMIDSNTISIPKGVVPKVNLGLPQEFRSMMLNMDFRNVIFKTEGLYYTRVFIDNEHKDDFPIYVKAGEPQK